MPDRAALGVNEFLAPSAPFVRESARHRWYLVKEGFSPAFVARALQAEAVEPDQLLLDPFAGGGTVPLSGAMAGLRVEACEVNPFLHFVSTAKLLSMDAGDLERSATTVLRSMERPVASSLEGVSTFTEGNRWGRWLFPLPAVRAFEAGKREVHRFENAGCRALLKLALLGAAMDCCNATRDGKCLRFRKGWKERQASAGRMRSRFESRILEIVADLDHAPLHNVAARLDEGDARKRIAAPGEKFRICVTSPPYLNSFDYSDVYRPELFLGDFVTSTDDLMRIRLRTIRSHVQASWEQPTRDEFGALYRQCVDSLREVTDRLWDKRLLTMVQAYFEDMERVLQALRSRALPSASVWLVVSTSAYGGVEIPVDLILADVGQRAGWFLREIEVLRYLRSSSQHFDNGEGTRRPVRLRESLLIFDACGTARTNIGCGPDDG